MSILPSPHVSSFSVSSSTIEYRDREDRDIYFHPRPVSSKSLQLFSSMASRSDRRDSSSELLHELEALSRSLFRSNPARHNASLVLDRSSIVKDSTRSGRGSMSQRLFLPPWRSQAKNHPSVRAEPAIPRERKGIWSWRPLRALSRITMQRIGCLFYVKAVAIRNLPSSTNGLRVRVSVRKKETKEGSVSTMPERIVHGSAEFDETLFIQCHLYYKGKLPVFERRLFAISVVAADATELDLGTSTVDLSLLVKESVERSFEGVRVREWDMNFELLGKAKGGDLVLKLGFQIMDGGGASIYNQPEASMKMNEGNDSLYPSISGLKVEDPDCPGKHGGDEAIGEKVSGEVVKEVVHQRITELESIAKQIKELESIMTNDEINATKRNEEQIQLNASEELATRKFLQMLDQREGEEPSKHDRDPSSEIEVSLPVSNLGKGLGPIVQTRDGGYLVSTNLFNIEVGKEESLKLAMQISKPFILRDQKQYSGLEVFQSLASMDPHELTSKLSSLAVMDELTGKAAEQVAFEGIASAIMNGRNKEGANFSAARSIATTKMMAKAIVEGSSDAKKSLMSMEEILAFSMKKIEEMVGEGLKIQAEMCEEEAPSDISNSIATQNILDSSTSLEEWEQTWDVATSKVKLLVTIQPRDPIRQYEPIGGLQIALVEAVKLESNSEDEEVTYTLSGIHVGGLKLRSEEGYRQRLSAMQWLAGFGMSKAGKNKKVMEGKIRKDSVWSLSSRSIGDAWLQPKRNPNVKFFGRGD